MLNDDTDAFEFEVIQKRKNKVSPEMRKMIIGWVLNHDNVRNSSNYKDTLKMKDGTVVGKKICTYQ